jgi:hypothetical protein
VSSLALLFLRTLLSVSKLAQFRCIVVVISSSVFQGVVVIATFMVVSRILFGTLSSLEVFEFEVLDLDGLSCLVMDPRNFHEKSFLVLVTQSQR